LTRRHQVAVRLDKEKSDTPQRDSNFWCETLHKRHPPLQPQGLLDDGASCGGAAAEEEALGEGVADVDLIGDDDFLGEGGGLNAKRRKTKRTGEKEKRSGRRGGGESKTHGVRRFDNLDGSAVRGARLSV
jgi:hypothetical protein